MTLPTDEELDALVKLSEKFVTATWHLLDNSETSGPIDDPTIAVWQPDFDEVSALLDRCEGLPSGSTEHMNAGELLSANMTAAITALRVQLAEVQAELVRRVDMHECAMAERDDATLYGDDQKARADRAEQRVAALEAAPVTMADAMKDVLAERQRQISAEGWTPEHDDAHINGEMAQAAACYTLNAAGWLTDALRGCWPMTWASAWFKPTDQRRDLVKAGALILAEIERLDRVALRAIEETTK